MILRVFPRRTEATPTDDLVRIGRPDMFHPIPGVSEIHISVAFTWDLPESEIIEKEYRRIYGNEGVKRGGPALGDCGGEFTPGRYLAPGHLITHRGCPNKCAKCFVPRREGPMRELEVRDGFIIHDSNLLACSPGHIDKVFEMLGRQKQRPIFVGGLEASRITCDMAKRIYSLKPQRLFTAFDRNSQVEFLYEAGNALLFAGFTPHSKLHCYVLSGFDGDTIEAATERCMEAWWAGFIPYAMLFQGDVWKEYPREWKDWQRTWTRPALTKAEAKRIGGF